MGPEVREGERKKEALTNVQRGIPRMGMIPQEKPHSSACPSSGYSLIHQHAAYFHLLGHPRLAMSTPGMYVCPVGHGKGWPHPHSSDSPFLSAPYPAPPPDCNFSCTLKDSFCDWVQAD